MKRTVFVLLACILLTACAIESAAPDKTISIATMGHVWRFMGGDAFLNGVELAVKEAAEEYEPLGYTIKHTFYDDEDDYSHGMLIVDELLNDKSLTAVIGSHNLSILEMAAHRFENAGKLMIAPHGIADNVLADNKYRFTLSTTYSSYDVGAAAKEHAINTGIKRWAVCYYDDTYSRGEVQGFGDYKNKTGAEIIDYQKIPIPEKDFDFVYKRWKALGVKGVFISPDNLDGFETLAAIRKRDNEMVLIGDFAFDIEEIYLMMRGEMEGFVMVNAFTMDFDSEDLFLFADRYEQEYESACDTWAAHGYNAARMVIDTAVKNGTADSGKIADALKNDGYTGIGCRYAFRENGEFAPDSYSIVRYNDGYFEEIKEAAGE